MVTVSNSRLITLEAVIKPTPPLHSTAATPQLRATGILSLTPWITPSHPTPPAQSEQRTSLFKPAVPLLRWPQTTNARRTCPPRQAHYPGSAHLHARVCAKCTPPLPAQHRCLRADQTGQPALGRRRSCLRRGAAWRPGWGRRSHLGSQRAGVYGCRGQMRTGGVRGCVRLNTEGRARLG